MAQNVKLPNGQIVSFPDDATPAEIDGALNTYYPQFAPKEHPYDALQRVVDTAISNTIPTETLPEVPRQPEAEAEAAAREDRIRQRREAEGIDKLGTFGRYTHSFASGAGLATGTGINYIGRRFGIQSLEEFGNQIQDVAAARTPADQTFGEQVVSGIGSVASALATAAPISIAAESAPVLAGIAGIATFAPRIAKGLQIVSQWAPSAFAGAFEAAGNATQTYDDVLKKTGNKDLALHQADKTFLLNLPVNAALDKIGIFNKEGGVASRIIRAKLAEGTQEGVQQAISNYFAGNPVGEQFTQNAVVGGVVGGLAKAGHIAVERLAGKDDDDSATPPPDINNATNVDEAIAAANASLQTTVGDELTPAIDAFKADWEARMRDAAPPPMIGMEEPAHQSIVMPERAAPQDIFAPDRPLSKPLLELAELLRGMNVEEQTRGLMRLDPLMRRDVSNVMRALDDTEPAGLIVPGAGIQPGQGEASRITNESTLAASSVQPAAAMPAATTGVPALTERAAREIISKTPGMEMRPHRDVANRFEVVPAVSTAGEARGVFSTQPVPVAQQQLADQEAPAVAAAPAPTVVPTVAPALTLEQQQSNQAALDAERSSQPRRMFGEHSRLRSESGPDIKGERVTRPMRKFLAQLGRLTGTKIVFEYAPNESDGVVPVHGENTIHINTAATINPLSVMGHEVTHVLKDKHREAWQAIRTALSDTLGTGEERRAALMRFADDYWFAHPDRLEAISKREDFSTPLTDEEKRAFGTSENTIEDFLLDELTSDLGGAHWSSEQFWTDTFAKIEKQHGDKARGIIERLVSAIKESLNKFMMLVRQHQQAPYTTVSAEQIEKTRDAVTSAYAKFISEERRNEPEHVEDVGVRDTEAEHAYHSNPTGEQQGVELDAARRAELGEIEPVESRNRDAETRMFFEVAPNPNNLPLKRAWDRLSDKQQRSISEEIKQRVIPGLLKSLGIRATIQGQLGGWMNDTNPSFALVVKGGDIAMAARAITHVLDQESVYTLGLKPFTGAQKSGIIRIEVGDRSRAQIHQLYMAVRRIEPKVILGHSTINGEMLIGLPIETMQAIESKVIDTLQQFNVEGVDFIQGYSSNVTESDYESWLYGSPGEHSEARDIDRWQADARRLFAGRSDGTGRPGLGSSLAEEARRSERRDGAVSAVGIHYSQAKRDYLASSAFGTGLKGAENERIAQSGDPRLKHRIYFYVNPGRAIRPEVGVGAHAHRAELTGLYDLQADSRNLALGRDANEFESALLDAGYNGYISHDRGVAVMLGPRSMRVDYMGLNNNPDVPVAERDVPSAYKAKQSAIMSNRILPSGQLTGAEWKAIVPAVVPSVDVSHLDDSRMYYRDQIVKRPVESQPRASEPRPVPKWYRSALADEAAAVTAKSMPVSGWQGWIKGLRANGKVKPDEITWSGIEDFIAAHGDARITADAVRAYLSEFGVKVQTLLRGESNPRTYDADVQVEEDEDEREYLEPDFHWGRPETEEPDEGWLYDIARDRYDEAVERMVDDEWDSTADVMRGYISHWSSFEKEAREQLGTMFYPSRDQVIAAAEALAIKDAAQESFEDYKTDNDPDDISKQELVERAVRILSDDDMVEKEARRRVEAGINEDELMSDLVDQEREWYYQDSDSPFTQTITVTVGDNEYEFTYRDGWGAKQVWDDDNRRDVDLGQNSYRLDEAGIQNAIWMHLIDEIGIDTHGAAVQRDTSGFIPTKWDSWATERYSAVAGSYREMQLLLPQGAVGDLTNRKREGVTYTVYDKDGNAQIETAIGEDRAKERAEEIGGRYEKNNYPVPITERNDAPDFYYTTHFPEANILGFFRFDERIDQDGKRVMFIQEIQSDWGSFWYKAQKAEKNLPAMRERMAEMNAAIDTARQKLKHALDNTSGTDLLRLERKDVGLSESAPVAAVDALAELHALLDDRGVREKLQRDINDAEYDISRKPVIGPFTDATPKWTALVVKRIIAHAVEYGFDRVAWTTGAQQVERWQGGLRQQIDRIEWDKTEKGVHIVALKNGKVRQSTRYAETELTDAIGKLMSDRIFNDPNQSGVIEGDGITIDDVGMAASYDRIIPNTVNDLLRRLDKTIKVREIDVGTYIEPATVVDASTEDGGVRFNVVRNGKVLTTLTTRENAEHDAAYMNDTNARTRITRQPGFDISDKIRDTAERGMPLFSERRRRESQRAERKADDRRAWYYSQLGAAVNDIPKKIRTGKEAAVWLQANASKLGIKKDELQWSGVLDYLQSQPTPAGVSDWLRDNGVKVKDVLLGAESDEYRRLDAELQEQEVEVARLRKAAQDDSVPPQNLGDIPNIARLAAKGNQMAESNLFRLGVSKEKLAAVIAYGRALNRKNELFEQRKAAMGERPKYEEHTLPGGSKYRELLLTLPENAKPYTYSLRESDTSQWEVMQNESFSGYAVYDKDLKSVSGSFNDIEDARDWLRQHRKDKHYDVIENETGKNVIPRATPSLTLAEGFVESFNKQHVTNPKSKFTSSHFNAPNILAHLRFNERTDADGKRVLFIEEVQSDWAQKGRKDGFNVPVTGYQVFVDGVAAGAPYESIGDAEDHATRALKHNTPDKVEIREVQALQNAQAAGNKGLTPVAPFVTDTKAWVALALKRAIAYAVDNGFDRVAWTTGEQQADRYDLSKQVESINYDPVDEWLTAYPKDSGRDNISQSAKLSELPDIIGKEAAKKIEQAIESAEYDRRQWSVEEDDGKFVVIDPNGEPRYGFGGELETFDTYADAEEWIDANYNDGQTGVTISGLDLKIGGEGMAGFYDQIVPQIARKLGATMRKVTFTERDPGTTIIGDAELDAEIDRIAEEAFGVEATPIRGPSERVVMQQPGFDITDDMRQQARIGMPLFSTQRRPSPELEAWLGKSVVRTPMYHGTARDITTFRPQQADAIFLTDNPKFAGDFSDLSRGWMLNNYWTWMTPEQITEAKQRARAALPPTGREREREMLRIDQSQGSSPYLRKEIERMMPSESNIMPLYVRAENPFDFRNPEHVAAIEAELGPSWSGHEFINGEMFEVAQHIGDLERGDWNAIESPQVQEYIRKNHDSFYVRERGVTNLAVFSPNQVKSASGNQGTYSREDNDIRRSERRFQPSGHGQYLTELKNIARDLDSNDLRTRERAQAWSVKVMDMPAVLRQVVDTLRGKVFRTVPQRIIGSGSTLLLKPMNRHDKSQHLRPVDTKVIFDLPKYLADPLAVFSGEGGTNPNSFRVVLRDRLSGSYPVVALEPKQNAGFVMTIHPGDDSQLQGWIDNGLLHYVDEKAAGLRPAATDGVVGGSIPRIPNVDWSVAKERAESKGRVVVTRDQVADMDEARLSAPRGAIAGQPINQSWQAPEMTDWDNFVRKMQDKQVDTKRVLQAIRDAGNTIAEKFDTYLQETLYHGRTATRVHNFVDGELRQLLEDMHRRNIGMQELDDYLWARHAVERNAQIAKVNPSMPDGGSGLTNVQAADILSGQQVTVGTRDIKLDTTKMRGYAAIATKVDAITNGTLDLLVKYGLEKQQTVNQWRRTYQHYAPLMRDMEADSGFLGAFNLGLGTGQGFNVRGSASKRAMGSQRSVTDVLANVAMQRERAIVRGEKNRIAQALYGLAISAPNTDFWIPVNPDLNQRLNPASLQKLIGELTHIGVNPIDAMNIAKEPKQRYIDNNTGMVAERINPSLRGRDDVLSTRINGEERFVMFSTDQRAQMMVRSLKNLDADQLGGFTQAVAPVTRWFASINTQFNPIFGLTNGIRDIGTGMLNLSSTPLSGHRADILRNTFSALKGVYLDLRDHRAGRQPTSQWAQLFEQFALDGGQTGYRDMFATSEDRANEIAKELKAAGNGQSWFAVGEKHSKVLGWLSDYNTAVENAVRLSAYKVALDNGRSRQDAARIAKELTVNFNRKGLAATQTGALYAFFNAAVQGTARIAETMIKDGKLTPAGQRIMYGGMLLGVMQAVMGALAGWDDNEPPQFVREKNLIIPIVGTDKYVSIPMPLGFHILPNIGRISAEFALSGFKNPSKRLLSLANVILDGFNPIGSGTLAQTLSPTIADPIVALSENKDWTGKSIYKEDFNKMHPTPGWTRTKDTASDLSKWLAYGVNYLTGGGKYEIGAVSPTPDQIDYLISQATGGVGREGLKVWQTGKAEATGEDVPMYKVPVAGRFVGETKGQASEIAKFYDNLKRIGEHKSAIDEMKQAHDSAALQAYYADHPDARFVQLADRAQREIGYLRRQKSDMIEKGVSRERIKLMEDRITAKVQGFNQMLTEKRE